MVRVSCREGARLGTGKNWYFCGVEGCEKMAKKSGDSVRETGGELGRIRKSVNGFAGRIGGAVIDPERVERGRKKMSESVQNREGRERVF